MLPSSNETILTCAANLSSLRGRAIALWSVLRRMKRGRSELGRLCPRFALERLCPDAIFIPPDFPRYRAVSQSVREILPRHTELIEPLSLDEAYLDITENKTNLPTATRVVRTIREQIREELHLTRFGWYVREVEAHRLVEALLSTPSAVTYLSRSMPDA
jgi:hypothetical protein